MRSVCFISYRRFSDIHCQLSDQLRCLDNRVETHDAMLLELQEFCKLKAVAEQEYSQRLDRIVKQTMSRHKADKQRLLVLLLKALLIC